MAPVHPPLRRLLFRGKAAEPRDGRDDGLAYLTGPSGEDRRILNVSRMPGAVDHPAGNGDTQSGPLCRPADKNIPCHSSSDNGETGEKQQKKPPCDFTSALAAAWSQCSPRPLGRRPTCIIMDAAETVAITLNNDDKNHAVPAQSR